MNTDAATTDHMRAIKTSFRRIGRNCYAFLADGFPNTGVIIGDDGVMIVDALPSAEMAHLVVDEIRKITDKPIKHIVLTHYHAERTHGASAYGAGEIITSDLTKRMIEERGVADRAAALERSSGIFEGGEIPPDAVRPTISFASSMSVNLGEQDVRIMHLGRGHTMGDIVVWVADAGVMFAGDLVERGSALYCGDAHLTDWPRALGRIVAFRPETLVPGSGQPVIGFEGVLDVVRETSRFVETLRDTAVACVDSGLGLKDTYLAIDDAMAPRYSAYANYERHMPINVARAYDEALGLDLPQVWTAERNQDLIDALNGALSASAHSEPTQQTDDASATEEQAPSEQQEYSEKYAQLQVDEPAVAYETGEALNSDVETDVISTFEDDPVVPALEENSPVGAEIELVEETSATEENRREQELVSA